MENSPLARLSGELRNEIYSYLTDPIGIIVCLCGRHHPFRPHVGGEPKTAGELWPYAGSHLPHTCRQLRQEALSYLFSNSTIVVTLQYLLTLYGAKHLESRWNRFVDIFGPHLLQHVRNMTILVGEAEFYWECRSPERRPGRPSRPGRLCFIASYCVTRHHRSRVDAPLIFARRSIRPSLHPAAKMLVRVDDGQCIQSPTKERPWHYWLDFDEGILVTAERIGYLSYPEVSPIMMPSVLKQSWLYLLMRWFGVDPADEDGKELVRRFRYE